MEVLRRDGGTVYTFSTIFTDAETDLVRGFGEEWTRFHAMAPRDLEVAGAELFDILPWSDLGPDTRVVDIGCGSGRWSEYLRERVGVIDAIDPSEAVVMAAGQHKDATNIRWSMAQAEDLPFADHSFDLALCIGVLHHLERPERALQEAFRVLRPGGGIHVYVYYALEQRGPLFRSLFRLANGLRRLIHRAPGPVKRLVCDLLAIFVYWPLATLSCLLKGMGMGFWHNMPLSFYHNKSLRVMRNDALDRFGTPLEQRFTKEEIRSMMTDAGLEDIRFSAKSPFWHAIGRKI